MTKYKISIIHEGCGGKITKSHPGRRDPDCRGKSVEYTCENYDVCGLFYKSNVEFQ